MSVSPKLFLLDGTALAYRAYFAFINSHLKNSEGLATGTIFGFANTIERLLEQEKPTHIAVAWDTSAPTFRHSMDENYKANRPPQPDDLRAAMPVLKELLSYYNIPVYEKDGFEADDILGTIAHGARDQNVDVFLVTPDKDYMQLVCDNIKMYKPLNNGDGFDIIDRDGVISYFGVPPEQVIDVLAIIGDTSDNIPGVPGVGKKTAPKVIEEYGSLEAAIQDAENIKAKRVREGLLQNADQARLSREMIVIKTDVPDTVSWQELDWNGPNADALGAFYRRMEFKGLTRRYAGEGMADDIQQVRDRKKKGDQNQVDLFALPETATETESEFEVLSDDLVTYHLVTSKDEIEEMITQLKTSEAFCFDTETTGTDPLSDRLIGIAFSNEKHEAWYVPIDAHGGCSLEEISPNLHTLFSSQQTKVAHNSKFDYAVLQQAGIPVQGKIFDTMLAAYLLDAGQKLGMDDLAKKYLNYQPVSITSLIGKKGKNQTSLVDVDLQDVYRYACEDADITWQLYALFSKELARQDLTKLAEEIEFPLSMVLARMETTGVHIDTDMLNDFSKALMADMTELQAKIYDGAGEEFNINSPQQLGEIMFGKLGLPAGKKTATGQYSTNEQVLTDLASTYEFPALILDFRSLSKLKSTYVDALPKLVHPKTGRIHSNFNQHITATGRLSSSQPNLQNIPIRTERGREIRKAFVAAAGFGILAADYSQIELRIIASISGDEAMQRAFQNDEDIHARTAKEIFGLSALDEVSREHRRKAKEVNFGIPYGVSAFGLAQRLGISNTEAKEIIEAYFERFPKIKHYIEETIAFATQNGYVETLSGRRRYIPDITSRNRNVQSFAQRTAINMPIQGTAADLIKLAMIRLDNAFTEKNVSTRMILQVHDELVFEVPESEKEVVSEMIEQEMTRAMTLKVPLKVEMGYADNWLEAH